MQCNLTEDRIYCLKHKIPPRQHYRLSVILTYIKNVDNIAKDSSELSINSSEVPQIPDGQKNLLAEFTYVLAEVRRVVRHLEAERKVTMSRADRFIRELYKAICALPGDMTVRPGKYHRTDSSPLAPTDDELPVCST